MKKIPVDKILFFLIASAWVLFHYILLKTDAIIMRDDHILISAVDSVVSIDDYVSKLITGYFYDIQPLRDLTFAINLKFLKWFDYAGFHLINMILGGLIIFYFRKLLLKVNTDKNLVNLISLLIAFHPVFNSTIAWVSNRKHLLAVFFILLYLLELLKKKPSELRSLTYVILSLLSQPITVFIPIIVSLDKIIFRKIRLSVWDGIVCIVCSVSLVINYYFYHTNIRFAARNYADASSSLGDYILRLSRVSVQLLFPTSIAVEYNLGSWLSYLGIPLSVLIIYLFYKFRIHNTRYLFLLLIPLSTLFPVLNWGVRDPYLLCMILASMAILVLFLSRFNMKYVTSGLCIYLAFFFFYSNKYTKMWLNDFDLFRVSVENEGGIYNLVRYGQLLGGYKPGEAYDIFQEILRLYPQDADAAGMRALKAEYLYKSPKYSPKEKINMFGSKTEVDIYEVFFLSKLHNDLGDLVKSKNALNALKKALEIKENEVLFSLAYCEKYIQECDDLGLRFRGERYSSVLPIK